MPSVQAMTHTPEPARIAGMLSEAQRTLATRHGDTRFPFYPGAHHRAAKALGDQGLLIEIHDSIGNVMWRWTELGKQVRDHIRAGDAG